MRIEVEDIQAVVKDLIYKVTLYPFWPANTEIMRSELLNDLTRFEIALEEMVEKRK